jgi:uncharacterized protein YgiB involved in biofilm formation
MKRSHKVALRLMVPVATLLLAGCSDNEQTEQALVFNSVEECSQSGLSTAEQCASDWESAKTVHPTVAPKYTDKYQCEADFGMGKCESVNSSGSSTGVFMPMMMGFMAANMLNRGNVNQFGSPNYAQQSSSRNTSTMSGSGGSYSRFGSQPLYKSRYDQESFRTGDNTPIANKSGLASVKPSQVQSPAGNVVARGGFGSQGAMRSTFGG